MSWEVFGLPCAVERISPGVVEDEGGAAVVRKEVAAVLRRSVTLYRHIIDGHRRDGAGAVAGREGDIGVPLCGAAEGEYGEVLAAFADIIRGTGYGDGLIGG